MCAIGTTTTIRQQAIKLLRRKHHGFETKAGLEHCCFFHEFGILECVASCEVYKEAQF